MAADSTVLLEIQMTSKGLKVAQKNLDKTTASVNKQSNATKNLNKQNDNFHKGMKGVGQAGLSGAKGFSKMNQTMGGSSGLVAAYATLAANIFAATAAFNALRNASKVGQLAEGLDYVGVAAGRNLGFLADNLKAVTGNAISTEQALRSTALAASSGFSNKQLTDLGKVAKGASIALGRDLGDALDRLVRGTAKLEPEILDELGIFVRLDDAVKNYADSVGKAVEDVSEFERRQAFLNEATLKGLQAFGDIADAADANPYDQLAATFNNLTQEILKFLNKGLIPTFKFFSQNVLSLGGTIAVLGSGVARNMVGAFYDGAAGAAAAAQSITQTNAAALGNLEVTKALPKAWQKVSESITSGNASVSTMNEGLQSLDHSLATHNGQLKEQAKYSNKESDAYKNKSKTIQGLTQTRANLINVMRDQNKQGALMGRANAIQAASTLDLGESWRFVKESTKEYGESLVTTNKSGKATKGMLHGLKVGAFGAATGFKALGTAVLTFLPYLGLILTFGPMIYDFFKNKLFPETLTGDTKAAIESLDKIGDTIESLTRKSDKGILSVTEFYTASAGVVQQASDAIVIAMQEDIKAGKKNEEEFEKMSFEMQALKDKLAAKAGGTSPIGYTDSDYQQDKLRLKSLQGQIVDLNKTMGDSGQRNSQTIAAAEAAYAALAAQTDETGEIPLIGGKTLDALQGTIQGFKDGTVSVLDLTNAFSAASSPQQRVLAGFQNMDSALKDLQTVNNDLAAKTVTPFDKQLESVDRLIKGFNEGEAAAIDMFLSYEEGQAIPAEATKALVEQHKKIAKAGFANIQQARDWSETLKTNVARHQVLPGLIQEAGEKSKLSNKFRKIDSDFLKAAIDDENALLVLQREKIQNEIDILEATLKLNSADEASAARMIALKTQLRAVSERETKNKTASQEIAIQEIKDTQKLFDLRKKLVAAQQAEVKAAMERRNIARDIARIESGADDLSAGGKLALFRLEKDTRIALEKQALEMRLVGIDLEYSLLEAQLELLVARAELDGKTLKNEKTIRDLYTQGREASKSAAREEHSLALDRIRLEEAQLKRAVKDAPSLTERLTGTSSIARTMSSAAANYGSEVNTQNEAVKAAEEKYNKAADPMLGGDMYAAKDALDEAKETAKASIQEAKMTMLEASLAPFIDQLKQLGPEGEMVAAIAQTSLIVADSFKHMSMEGIKSGEAFAAAGNMIAGVASIMAAASNAKIAGIDKEIDAEKKRDGKSKESLNKIKQLEAKKESQKRKAFEQNKKMMMAQTVMNTAAAYMGIMAAESEFGMLAPVLAGVALVMGAAQLAIIAGTSYEGGGGSVGSAPATPTIAVGERKSSVDLAKSQSAGGELAYLRGAQGTGGPENFTPAFMGANYRATGGRTAGYVVGEQGPELFVPEMPGRVVPNNEIGQTAPTNVNINIQALDSEGVDRVMEGQTGNIISMIRTATNAHGEDFYNNIDTEALSIPNSVRIDRA